eukprot:scaffold116_cov334-Pavlova_lutheri.AAC.30
MFRVYNRYLGGRYRCRVWVDRMASNHEPNVGGGTLARLARTQAPSKESEGSGRPGERIRNRLKSH